MAEDKESIREPYSLLFFVLHSSLQSCHCFVDTSGGLHTGVFILVTFYPV